MVEAEIDPKDLRKLVNKFRKLDKRTAGNALFRAVQMASFHVTDKLKRNLQGPILGKGQHKFKGSLRQSIGSKVTTSGQGIRGVIGSGVNIGKRLPYANIHETGGVVKPKTAKFLTIPFPGIFGRARDFNNTFIAKNVIFQKTGKDSFRPLFSLKRSVNIPARRYLSKTLQQNMKRAVQIMSKTIDEIIAKAR